ncbi:legumin1 [Zea mays]|uniref:Legumin1 n=1 Tax=Zea mays TaxID=4577 RepID=A0A1D6LI05_MAIZE|nr:legumin1 [Zea mays]
MASWRPWSRATRCSLRPAPSSTSAGSTKPTGSSPAPASSPSASSSTPWASCSLDTPTSIRLSTSSKGEGSLGSRFRDAKRRPSSSSMDTDMDMDTITISMTTTRSTDSSRATWWPCRPAPSTGCTTTATRRLWRSTSSTRAQRLRHGGEAQRRTAGPGRRLQPWGWEDHTPHQPQVPRPQPRTDERGAGRPVPGRHHVAVLELQRPQRHVRHQGQCKGPGRQRQRDHGVRRRAPCGAAAHRTPGLPRRHQGAGRRLPVHRLRDEP